MKKPGCSKDVVEKSKTAPLAKSTPNGCATLRSEKEPTRSLALAFDVGIAYRQNDGKFDESGTPQSNHSRTRQVRGPTLHSRTAHPRNRCARVARVGSLFRGDPGGLSVTGARGHPCGAGLRRPSD